MLFNQLPEDVILRIFSFISFHLIRRTISLVCKMWNRISEDPSIVRKAPSENFESIRLHECLTFTQLKNVVERVIWVRTADIKLLDLAKTVISWEYVDSHDRRNNWRSLRILNIAKLEPTAEFNVTATFANLLELNVCESRFNDNDLVEVSRICKTLRVLNVSGCTGITDFGFKKAFLKSVTFINISDCTLLTEQSINRIIETWETMALCVKGLQLSAVRLEELYGDDIEAGIIFLCGLYERQARKCVYCKEGIFWTWTDIKGIHSLEVLEI